MYCDIGRSKNMDFLQTLRNYHGAVSSISANYLRREPSTPQPPASVPHFCYRRVLKTTLNSQRLKCAMLPCILVHATACQLCEFTLDLLHEKFISSSITIDCSPRPHHISILMELRQTKEHGSLLKTFHLTVPRWSEHI